MAIWNRLANGRSPVTRFAVKGRHGLIGVLVQTCSERFIIVVMLRRLGTHIASFLSEPREKLAPVTPVSDNLAAALKNGDVLLVEGTSRISSAIKYLTQSSWSHAAIYVGDSINRFDDKGEALALIEADLVEGVRAVPLSFYAAMHTRICRPVGLSRDEIDAVLQHVISRLGHTYDLKNILDLARYFITTPPVPGNWKRRMIAFGSGDPTRAICSSLIAEAFQSIRYPILPDIEVEHSGSEGRRQQREVMHIRHHSLFAPRDFDVSPYFEIIKPSLNKDFDFRRLHLR
jgi:hypothetical protein